MVLVDTTVWIAFFGDKPTLEVAELERLLNAGEDICTCGIILTEVLQGIRDDVSYRKTLSFFDDLLYLPMNREVFVMSAQLYRSLRRRGLTIRKPVDCMIASVAITHGAVLLHNDRDFDPINKHCSLRVIS